MPEKLKSKEKRSWRVRPDASYGGGILILDNHGGVVKATSKNLQFLRKAIKQHDALTAELATAQARIEELNQIIDRQIDIVVDLYDDISDLTTQE